MNYIVTPKYNINSSLYCMNKFILSKNYCIKVYTTLQQQQQK